METPSIRKPSVTFNLSPIYVEEHDSEMAPTIDIHAQAISDSIMVSLVDRSAEMIGLARYNSPYFKTLKHYLEDTWPAFEEILYSERSKISDDEWIEFISNKLEDNPPLLESFKELVGYIEDIPQEEEQEEEEQEQDGDKLVCLRDSPNELDQSITCYP